MNCASQGATQTKWYHNGRLIDNSMDSSTHRLILPNGSLFFLRIATTKKDSDEGMYWCVVHNSGGSTRSRNATIEIAFIDEHFIESPRPFINAIMGDSLTLPCHPPSGTPKPSLSWTRNDMTIRNNSRVYTTVSGDLHIVRTEGKDSGSYECRAENLAGTKTSQPSTVMVIDPPKFVIAPQNQTVTTGSTLSLPCQVTGYPTPTIEWLRPGGKIPLGRTKVTSEHTMILSQVQSSDSGVYTCIAENEAGIIRVQVNIEVLALPYFKERPNDQVLKVGTSYTMPCSIAGDPNPLLLWRLPGDDPKDILLINHKNENHHVNSDGSLFIENVQMYDSGFYNCFGTNSGGGIISRSKILAIESFPPPIVGIAPKDLIISDGDTITLPCEPASEAAEPTVSWWFRPAAHLPQHEVTENSAAGITLSGNIALIIRNANRTNSGIYTCLMKAETGEAEATAVVRYEENSIQDDNVGKFIPAPPSKPRVRILNGTSVRLTWQPNSSQIGMRNPMVYTVEFWRHGWTEWRIAAVNVASETAIISGLSQNYTYTFLVRSITGSEQSFPSPWSNPMRLDIHDKNIPSLRTRWQADRKFDKPIITLKNASAISSTSVKLSWEDLNEENEIDGVLVYWISHDAPNSEGTRNPSHVHVATVLGSSSTSHVVRGLHPFTYYTFFLVPFWRNVEGTPTNSVSLFTHEDVPSAAPQSVTLTRRSSTKALLTWDKIIEGKVPGQLLGYAVVASCNGTISDYNVSTPWIELDYPISRCLLTARVAAMTSNGIGPFSSPALIEIGVGVEEINIKNAVEVDQNLVPSTNHLWLLYLLVCILVFIIIGLALYLRGNVRCYKTPDNHTRTKKCCDHSICASQCRVNMYGENNKTWSSSGTPRLQPNVCLLGHNHYVNDYAEPNNIMRTDMSQVEAYTTTALMAPTTQHHELSRPGMWTGFLPPPPPSSPPPPLGQYSGSEGTTCSSNHSSSDSYNRGYPVRQSKRTDQRVDSPHLFNNDDMCGGYERPCDETSEHTYEVYNQRPNVDAYCDAQIAVGYPVAHQTQHYSPTSSTDNSIKGRAIKTDRLSPQNSEDIPENIPLRRSPNDDTFSMFNSIQPVASNKKQ